MQKTPTPPAAKYHVSYSTIGSMIDGGYQVAMHCAEMKSGATCGFWKWIDLDKLAAKLGRDHGSLHADLIPAHLWCLRCGSRNIALRLHPPAPSGGAARSHRS